MIKERGQGSRDRNKLWISKGSAESVTFVSDQVVMKLVCQGRDIFSSKFSLEK